MKSETGRLGSEQARPQADAKESMHEKPLSSSERPRCPESSDGRAGPSQAWLRGDDKGSKCMRDSTDSGGPT